MYTYGYMFYIPITTILVGVGVVNGLIKKRKMLYYFFMLIGIIYLNIMIDKVFFPIFTDGSVYYTGLANSINWDITRVKEYSIYQIAYNFLVTVPIGFILPFIINSDLKERMIITAIVSVMLEIVQLILIISLHLIDITFDIADIVINALGGLAGNLMFTITCKLFTKSNERNTNVSSFEIICNNCAHNKKSMGE